MSRAARVAIAVAAGLLVLLVAAQLALPGIAEHRLRDDLKKSGEVEHVSISAFPAPPPRARARDPRDPRRAPSPG